MSKEVINELSNYKLELFLECIGGEFSNEDYIIDLLKATIAQPNILYIHPNKKRTDRDGFIFRLRDNLNARGFERAIEYLDNKVNIINAAENNFDKISSILSQCEIEKLPFERKVWAHISRAEKEYSDIMGMVESKISNRKTAKSVINSGTVLLKDEHGNEFCPDAAYEKITTSLSLALGLIAYQNDCYIDGKITLPERVEVEEDDTFKAGSTQLFAMSWKALEDVSYRCLLFGGTVNFCIGQDVPEEARIKGKISESYHFSRNESVYEVYDSIANERLNRKISQNYFEMLHHEGLDNVVISDLSEINSLNDGRFLSLDEISTGHAIQDVFCTDILTDKSTYSGLTLFEWVRSYSCLKFICEDNRESSYGVIIDSSIIENSLVKSGLNLEKAKLFIDLVTFGRDSRDLYDCPLLKLENNKFYILSHPLLVSSLSIIILSRMSSLQVVVDKKGYDFEKITMDQILNITNKCDSFKFKRENNEYEYDVIFILDNKIFLLECKNRTLSGFNPVHAYRKKQYIDETVLQVNRLKSALLEYPEVLKEKFGINVIDYEIVPVILNCLPFSWKGAYDGVYCTDSSSLGRFFTSGEINAVVSEKVGDKRALNKTAVYKLWASDKPTSSDLIRQLENPIQLKEYLDSRIKSGMWWPSDNTTAFTVDTFSTDSKALLKSQKKIFARERLFKELPVNPNKKKKLLKRKKKIVKSAKKKNRRK